MYVDFMKNFLLADSREMMAVRLILASWAQKRLIPTFYTSCTSSSWKTFFSPIPVSWWLLDSFWHPEPKTSDSYFVDMMYVEFMTNVLLADSSVVLAVRLILASWAQKRLIPTFYTSCTSSSWKTFFSPIPVSWWLLDSFWHPEPKTSDSYFVDMMYVEFMTNVLLADSSVVLAVRLILASWAQKQMIPTL